MQARPLPWPPDPQQQFFERRLRLHDDGVGAGIHQRAGLFLEGLAHLRSVKSPYGSSRPPNGPISPITKPGRAPNASRAIRTAGLVDLAASSPGNGG